MLDLIKGFNDSLRCYLSITFREENGTFRSIDEIQKVSGIGPVTVEKIKDFITVDELP